MREFVKLPRTVWSMVGFTIGWLIPLGIMRLVGATRWYTQLPFLLEAVVAAVVGAALAIGGLFAAKSMFVDDMLSEVYDANIVARITDSDVVFIAPFLVLVGVGMAALTSYVTLRLYVRE